MSSVTTPLGFRLASPEMLILAALVPCYLLLAWRGAKLRRPRLRYSSAAFFDEARPTLRVRLMRLPFLLRLISLLLIIFALARPQFGYSTESQRTLGVDIVIAVDMSDSMTAEDFRPNRLAAARSAMREFVQARPSDNIGIVGFGSYAAMLCPMTPDVPTVMQFIDLIDFRQLGRETAMGDALMLSVKKLEASDAKSKVVVLMTDGHNTAGSTDPLKGAEIAAALGITVHTIGIGSDGTDMGRGGGFSPLRGTRLSYDPDVLNGIAQMTGGRFHNATDEQRFTEVFRDIDSLEKSRIELETSRDFAERFQIFIWAAVALLMLDLLLGATWLRRLP